MVVMECFLYELLQEIIVNLDLESVEDNSEHDLAGICLSLVKVRTAIVSTPAVILLSPRSSGKSLPGLQLSWWVLITLE